MIILFNSLICVQLTKMTLILKERVLFCWYKDYLLHYLV